jgi:RND family efflux transporter MFP subunit
MNRRSLTLSGIVVVIVAIAAWLFVPRLTASAASTTVNLQTATVRRGTLVATVSAAGNVAAPEEANLAFQTSGVVAKVNVQIGDQVKKGEVLMQLDPTDLELALQSAQANLASAQANYDAAKIKDSQNANQLTIAKAALDKATVALQQAQDAYNQVAWEPNVGMLPQSTALQQASIEYQSALATYNITAAGINDIPLKTAQAQLDSAKIAVQQAQDNLDNAQIVAPFDGQIAAVNYNVGDTAGLGTAVTLVNLTSPQVDATLSELDIVKVKPGETAQLTFDALPGKTYTATVAQIDPVGVVTQGVVNYNVLFNIADADSAIKPGMTANLSIEVARDNNVLIVPTRAVHTQGNLKTVTVLYKGQAIPVPVQTGLSNDQNIEVTGALQPGDQVILNQVQTSPPRFGGGFGGFGRFGG